MKDQKDPRPCMTIRSRQNNFVKADKFGHGSNSNQIVSIPDFMTAQAKATEQKVGPFNFD